MGRRRRVRLLIISALFISVFSAAQCLLFPRRPIRGNRGRSAPAASVASATRTALRTTQLDLSRYRHPYKSDLRESDNSGANLKREQAVATDRPVLTSTDQARSAIMEPIQRQKIVVLGASGKIGRLVIKHLMQSSIDATIVAFCRDSEKACRVLSDDLIAVQVTAERAQGKHRGPQLEIVEGEIAPPGISQKEVQDIVSMFYNESSSSTASSKEKRSGTNDTVVDNPLLTLAEAIHGASAVISCVGSVRDTHLWTDLIARPFWRILRPNVTGWCIDQRHPYYAHYLTTKIALQLAEGEERARLRRQHEREEAQDKQQPSAVSRRERESHQKRMRFIRISDLCVSQRPWQLVPFMTNLLHSMVLRYQDMAEEILQQSSFVETIVLRPGDLVSELDHNAAERYDHDQDDGGERDETTTAVQVGIDGWLPEPSRIGRDDVAALAVAAALFDSKDQHAGDKISTLFGKRSRPMSPMQFNRSGVVEKSLRSDSDDVFHYTLACRWVGDRLHPYPPQGQMRDGHVDARVAMQQALTTLIRREKHYREESQLEPGEMPSKANAVPPKKRRRRFKPYGLIVSIPTYAILFAIANRFARLAITTILKMLGISQLPQPVGLPTMSPWLLWCANTLLAVLQTVTGAFLSGKAIPHQYIPV